MANEYSAARTGRAAARAERDPFFVAWAFAAYRHERQMTDEQLADHLGCALDAYYSLALGRRPEAGPGFAERVTALAREFGADSFRLRALLRDVSSRQAVRGATDIDVLAAARDREDDESEDRPPDG